MKELEDKCQFCGKPDSDTVPLQVGVFSVKQNIRLVPVCDDCIIRLKAIKHA